MKIGFRELTERIKPAARARTHMLAGALLWTTVGFTILKMGITMDLAGGELWWLLAGLGLTLGLIKGRFVLSKTARKACERIRERGDGKCLGGFISWRSWMLVGFMILLGRVIRHSGAPVYATGVIYTMVGVALLTGATVFWAAWRKAGR